MILLKEQQKAELAKEKAEKEKRRRRKSEPSLNSSNVNRSGNEIVVVPAAIAQALQPMSSASRSSMSGAVPRPPSRQASTPTSTVAQSRTFFSAIPASPILPVSARSNKTPRPTRIPTPNTRSRRPTNTSTSVRDERDDDDFERVEAAVHHEEQQKYFSLNDWY